MYYLYHIKSIQFIVFVAKFILCSRGFLGFKGKFSWFYKKVSSLKEFYRHFLLHEKIFGLHSGRIFMRLFLKKCKQWNNYIKFDFKLNKVKR
jgi:hypothetical protein